MMYVNYYDELFTYIPHQVPVNMTIPFVNVMYTYGTALMERVKTGQLVELTFPPFTYNDPSCDPTSAVCIPSGPAAELAVPLYWDFTGVLVLSNVGESRICKAGQASFNPKVASSQSDPSGNFAVNASIVKAVFSEACAAEPDPSLNESNPCAPCFNDIDAALLNAAAMAGKVAIVRAVEVVCIGSYKSIVDLLARTQAVGVLVASASDAFTMYAETGYVSSIPAFSIDSTDAAWILERVSVTAGRRGGSAGGALRALASSFTGRMHEVVESLRGTANMPLRVTTAPTWAVANSQMAVRIGARINVQQRSEAGLLGLREAVVGGQTVSALLPKLEEVCESVDEDGGRVCVGRAPSYEVSPITHPLKHLLTHPMQLGKKCCMRAVPCNVPHAICNVRCHMICHNMRTVPGNIP